jgi:predicted HTH domain antitoxin
MGRPRIQVHFPEEVLAGYRSGELSLAKVARRCDVSREVAARELRRVGVTLRPGGRHPTPPVSESEVVKRYRDGETLARLAEALGVKPSWVRAVLRSNGIDPRSRAGRPRIQVHFPEEVLAGYRSGELNLERVARRCGVSMDVAARELRRVGETVRPKGRQPSTTPVPDNEVVKRYRDGESLGCLAEALGVRPIRVQTVLRRNGISLRPRCGDHFLCGRSDDTFQRVGASTFRTVWCQYVPNSDWLQLKARLEIALPG